MKQIVSSDVSFTKSISMRRIMEIYHLAKKYKGTIYFIRDSKIINIKHLPSLVSFLLLLREHQMFKIMIDGEEPQDFFQEIKEMCNLALGGNEKTRALNMLETDYKVKV